MAAAVFAAIVFHATLPHQIRVGPLWLYPVVAIGLLLVLVIGDPGRIDKRDRWLRVVTGILITFLTVDNAASAIRLVHLILDNKALGGGDRLLGTGAAIWLINVIAFGLWYWDLDQGGAAERATGTVRLPAFLFPEMTNPEFVTVRLVPVARRLPAPVVCDGVLVRSFGCVRHQALVKAADVAAGGGVTAARGAGRRPRHQPAPDLTRRRRRRGAYGSQLRLAQRRSQATSTKIGLPADTVTGFRARQR